MSRSAGKLVGLNSGFAKHESAVIWDDVSTASGVSWTGFHVAVLSTVFAVQSEPVHAHFQPQGSAQTPGLDQLKQFASEFPDEFEFDPRNPADSFEPESARIDGATAAVLTANFGAESDQKGILSGTSKCSRFSPIRKRRFSKEKAEKIESEGDVDPRIAASSADSEKKTEWVDSRRGSAAASAESGATRLQAADSAKSRRGWFEFASKKG
uniref:Uncharacterized protein n=1 Tax=Panagrolaimus sp. JU765 TaxID=591449 RepID=A0AC34R692_9BILA